LIFTTRRNLIFINELRRDPKIIYAKSVYLSDTETKHTCHIHHTDNHSIRNTQDHSMIIL